MIHQVYVEENHYEESELSSGGIMRGIKGVDCLSHYVCWKLTVAATELVLLKNVDAHVRFSQIFADTTMSGNFDLKLSNIICTFHS